MKLHGILMGLSGLGGGCAGVDGNSFGIHVLHA